MLLDVLKRKGLKCACDEVYPPVLPGRLAAVRHHQIARRWNHGSSQAQGELAAYFQEAQDLLGRLGYEFVTGRRLQTAPKDTSKEIYLKMIRGIHDEAHQEYENIIWVRMDMDTAMKSLALGFLP